jgi:hypothetical protein
LYCAYATVTAPTYPLQVKKEIMSSTEDQTHAFLPHMSNMIGLGASEVDWPTGADLYSSSMTGSAAGMHDNLTAGSFPMGADYANPLPIKKSGRKAPKLTSGGVRSPASGANDKVEVIICQGTATVIPKSRSTVERRYICNGHPIHRVTFWRHRKHGCPHVTGEGGEGYANGKSEEGYLAHVPSHMPSMPKSKRTTKEKLPMDHHGDLFGNSKVEVPDFSHSKIKQLPMGGYPMVDAVVDLAPQNGNQYGFSMNDITPGNVPTQLDASSLGPQVPSFQNASNNSQYGFLRAPGQGVVPSQSGQMMPPFSLLTDALNLYYAPYRQAELDEEEISSPIHTTYVNHSSPYHSDRSEASDFMEESATDGMFKSYLERNE